MQNFPFKVLWQKINSRIALCIPKPKHFFRRDIVSSNCALVGARIFFPSLVVKSSVVQPSSSDEFSQDPGHEDVLPGKIRTG